MEKDRSKKILILGILTLVILLLTVAFATMSTVLNINGTGTFNAAQWNIYFDNLSIGNIKGNAQEITKPSISNKTTIENIEVNLNTPKDEISYDVNLVNGGDIDAKISDIILPTLSEKQQKYLEIKLLYDDGTEVAKEDVLQRMTLKKMTLKVKYKDDILKEDLPDSTETIKISCQITFAQADNKEISSNATTIVKEEEHANDTYPGDITNGGMYDGSEANPYQVESIEDLVQFSTDVSNGTTYSKKYVLLSQDINFNESSSYVDSKTTVYGDINEDGKVSSLKEELTTGFGFIPIGNSKNYFSGTFNGNDKTISNLMINRENTDYVGLFSIVANLVKNLNFKNSNIKGKDYVGVLAGRNTKKILNINLITSSVEGNASVGCVIGYSNANTIISGINVEGGKIKGTDAVGGVAGGIYASTSNGTKIMSALSKIDVEGNTNIGGIVGASSGYSENTIKGAYLGGNITFQKNGGRILGSNGSTPTGYAIASKSYLNGATVSSSTLNTINGLDINSLDEVTIDINMADIVFDTYINGDDDGDGYVLDYTDNGKLEKIKAEKPSFESGAGTDADPYIIKTPDDLKKASYDLTKSYKLGNDIDMAGKKHYMIGNFDKQYSGIFDGDGYTIENITIDEPKLQYVGIFGYAKQNITNVKVKNANITGYKDVGGLTGYSPAKTTISNISIESGKIKGNENVGGIVGRVSDSTYNGSKVMGALSKIDVEGNTNVGGIVGYSSTYSSSNVIKGVYLGGNITFQKDGGRLLGGGTVNSNGYAIASKSYLNGATVSSSTLNTINGLDINSLDEVTIDINMADIVFDTYINGDDDGDGYVLDYTDNGKLEKIKAEKPSFESGAGTDADPYIIKTPDDLKKASYDLTKSYKLGNDIDMAGKKHYMIGNFDKQYSGIFDGDGYTIENITIDEPKLQYVGIFGYAKQNITNVKVKNANITGYKDVGGLTGYSPAKTTISNISIESGKIKGNENVGGIVGRVSDSTYNGSKVMGALSKIDVEGNTNVGGIVGYSSTYSSSNVIKGVYLGGNITFQKDGGRLLGGGTVNSNGYAIASKSYLNGATVSSSTLNTINGLDINSLDEVTIDINMADIVFDTYINGDDDGDGYVLDYTDNGKLEKIKAEKPSFESGAGTDADPYIIKTPDDLKKASYDLTKSYKLGNDIDMAGKKHYMIGNFDKQYSGIFDGDGYTIENITIDEPKLQYVGIFGYAKQNITNVKVKNANITGYKDVGGLTGYSPAKTTISNISIESGKIKGNENVGGIVGRVSDSTYNGSKVMGALSKIDVEGNTNVGGIVGYSSTYSSSNVIKGVYLGGNITFQKDGGRLLGGGTVNSNGYAIASKSYLNGATVSSSTLNTINGLDMEQGNLTQGKYEELEFNFDSSLGTPYWIYKENGIITLR